MVRRSKRAAKSESKDNVMEGGDEPEEEKEVGVEAMEEAMEEESVLEVANGEAASKNDVMEASDDKMEDSDHNDSLADCPAKADEASVTSDVTKELVQEEISVDEVKVSSQSIVCVNSKELLADSEAVEPSTSLLDVGSEPFEEVGSEPFKEVGSEPFKEVGSEPSLEVGSEPSIEVESEPSKEVKSEVKIEPFEEADSEPLYLTECCLYCDDHLPVSDVGALKAHLAAVHRVSRNARLLARLSIASQRDQGNLETQSRRGAMLSRN